MKKKCERSHFKSEDLYIKHGTFTTGRRGKNYIYFSSTRGRLGFFDFLGRTSTRLLSLATCARRQVFILRVQDLCDLCYSVTTVP